MSSKGREIAKFCAGWAASETVGHWWLGIWGASLFPLKLGQFTFTSTWNMAVMIVWPLLLAMLIYFAWIRHPANERTPWWPTRSTPA